MAKTKTTEPAAPQPAPRELVATVSILVPLPDGALDLAAGEVVTEDAIPAGSLGTMLHFGQLVPIDEYDAPTIAPTSEPDSEPTPLESLTLDPVVIEKLAGSGLTTREQVVAFAKANEGLAKAGLDEAEEEAVFAALTAPEA